MAKKKDKKIDEIFEQTEIEPIEGKAPETESVLDEDEAAVSDADLRDDEENSEEADQTPGNDSFKDDEISAENLLDDVRRSLIEENAEVEEEKKPSWWQKLGGGGRKTKTSGDATPAVDEPEEQPVVLDDVDVGPVVELQESADESIDDLIEMLATDDNEEALSDTDVLPVDAQVEIEEEQPEVEKVAVDELKKRAFQGRKSDEEDEDFSDVRAVALEGGEEVFVEVEVKAEDPMEDRIKSFENALKPYRRYINFGIAFIGIVAIVSVAMLIMNVLKVNGSQFSEPTPTPSNLPYPVKLTIVDSGFSFNLSRGRLEDGRWNPSGPEWLEGTEVCRWVAILYSRPLEAALRTLTQKDQLELVMSNGDVLVYDVYSITQMSIEDMQAVSSNSSCLLLVLADANTDTRLVVTAYP